MIAFLFGFSHPVSSALIASGRFLSCALFSNSSLRSLAKTQSLGLKEAPSAWRAATSSCSFVALSCGAHPTHSFIDLPHGTNYFCVINPSSSAIL